MRRIAAFALVMTLLPVTTPAADASWTESAPDVVRAFGCTASATTGDAVASADGVIRGFVRPVGGTCTASRPTYVERRNGTWSRSLAPYPGTVLSVADDGERTYVLYRALDGLRLGARARNGAYAASKHLSTVRPRSGDVTAAYGRWWAVWSENTTSGAALFQARTMRTAVSKERITFAPRVDDFPTIARLTDGSMALAWQRRDAATGDTNVYRGRSTSGSTWSTAPQTDDGGSTAPSIAAYGRRRLLAWNSGGRVVFADDVTGAWRTRTMTARGSNARVAGSGSRAFVAWSTSAGNAALAERSGDVWTERNMTPNAGGTALAVTAASGNATVLVAEPTRVLARTQARPPITAFRGHGAWVDFYDTGLPHTSSVATMRSNGVKTLYLQTGRFSSSSAVLPETARWLDAAKAAGLKVVGWYLPGYSEHIDKDVARTVAAARFRTAKGNKFDAIGVDIEHTSSSSSTAEFNAAVVTHLRRVRTALGPRYPIGAITPPPTGMELNPNGWAGFPWAGIGRYSDVVVPMAYWSYRTGCPANPRHCAYQYTVENAALSSRYTGLPVHVAGGVGNVITTAEVRDFARGTNDSVAIGGSLYDFATTAPAYWPYLRTIR